MYEEEAEDPRPRDVPAEHGLLAAMMFDPGAIDAVEIHVNASHYYRTAHGLIHDAIVYIHGEPGPSRPDPITVGRRLEAAGTLARCGGSSYLHSLVRPGQSPANAESYAETVRDMAKRRRMFEIAARLLERARDGGGTPDEMLDDALSNLQALVADGGSEAPKLSAGERWAGFIDELEAGVDPASLETPWKDLNRVVQLRPGQLVTVGAETGGGKSLLGVNSGQHIALKKGLPVLVSTLEMEGTELLARLTAAEAGVNLDHLINRKLTESDWEKIARISGRMQRATNFMLDDSATLTVSKIRARVRWMATQGIPPALVIVDYLQLVNPERRGGSRTQEVAEISRGLKSLAMEFKVPVMALAQFNRSQVGRKPLVSDFKDSSQIEQDSNVILLMYRDQTDDPEAPDNGVRYVEVAKNRNGPKGLIVDLEQQGHYARLVSRSRQPEPVGRQ